MDIEEYVTRFDEEPGYLNFASVGPFGRAVQEEVAAQMLTLSRARFGSLDALRPIQDERMRSAIAPLVGRSPDQVVFHAGTSEGPMHAMFGLAGTVLVSDADFPTLPFAVARAAQAFGRVAPRWLERDHGLVTPGTVREQLDDSVTAVAVGLVDFRTGHLVDLEGIRQVIGDRLLVVDAAQGFGIVDAPYELADVVSTGGQKWLRAGWGCGFTAFSDRAIERIAPVWSGFPGTDSDEPLDEVPPPSHSARAFQVTVPDGIAEARLAAAAEELARVGVPAVARRVAEKVARVIEVADEFAVPVVSPRAESERAGIVTLQPDADQLTVLAASLHNHGVTATVRGGTVRLSAHASTTEETLGMLRAALLSFVTAVGR